MRRVDIHTSISSITPCISTHPVLRRGLLRSLREPPSPRRFCEMCVRLVPLKQGKLPVLPRNLEKQKLLPAHDGAHMRNENGLRVAAQKCRSELHDELYGTIIGSVSNP